MTQRHNWSRMIASVCRPWPETFEEETCLRLDYPRALSSAAVCGCTRANIGGSRRLCSKTSSRNWSSLACFCLLFSFYHMGDEENVSMIRRSMILYYSYRESRLGRTLNRPNSKLVNYLPVIAQLLHTVDKYNTCIYLFDYFFKKISIFQLLSNSYSKNLFGDMVPLDTYITILS